MIMKLNLLLKAVVITLNGNLNDLIALKYKIIARWQVYIRLATSVYSKLKFYIVCKIVFISVFLTHLNNTREV